jgi:hypothetical protein
VPLSVRCDHAQAILTNVASPDGPNIATCTARKRAIVAWKLLPFRKKPETPLLEEDENLRDIIRSYDQEEAVLSVMEANGDHIEALCVRVLVESGLRSGELTKRVQPAQITIETDAEQNEVGRISLRGKQTKGKEHRSVTIPANLAREVRAVIASGKMPSGAHLLNMFKKARDYCGYPREPCDPLASPYTQYASSEGRRGH